MMKEGWEYKKIADVCKIERGGSPRPIKKYLTNDDNGINWIKIGDTDPQGKYIYSTAEKIIPEGLKKSRWVDVDDFLLSNSMSFGRPYIMKTNGCIHDGWLVLRDYQNTLDIDFFYYLLLSPLVQRQFIVKAQGSTVSNLNIQRVADVNICIPPLSEQKEIVEHLDSSFAKIDTLKANAAKNLNEAKALFQSALKEALEPKKGWEEKMLGTLGTLKNGMNFSKNESGTELHILGISDFGNLFSISNTEDLSVISLNEMPSEDYLLQNEDVVFVRSNGNKNLVGRCVIVYPDNIKTTFSGFCIRFRKTSKEINTTYLVWFLKAPGTRKKIVGNGANISNLNQKILQSLAIPIPPLSEQQEIVSRLDSLNEKVNTLQQNYSRICSECDALKQAILRQVFE
jgi:restriction endonuclease S subunit